MKNRKIVFLTLAKGQSLRLKDKNTIPFKGKPLIHWVIKKILKISKNYYVNSDSNFILDYSIQQMRCLLCRSASSIALVEHME